MKLAYFVYVFPKISEVFIAHELVALSRLKKNIIIVAISKGNEKISHPFLKEINLPICYLSQRLFWNYLPKTIFEIINCFVHYPKTTYKVLHEFGVKQKYYKDFIYAVVLSNFLRRQNIDHLHAHFNTPIKIGLLSCLISNIDFSCMVHSKVLMESKSFWKKVGEKTSFIRTEGNYMKSLLMERMNKKDRDKVIVLPMGIDLQSFLMIKKIESKRGILQILSVGRLVPQKGFLTLIKALGILRDKKIFFHLHLIGGGPEENKIKKMINKLHLESFISLYGSLEQDKKFFEIYSKGDLYVLPCVPHPTIDADGLPTSLVEAMAAGLPIVSTNISNIPELVDKNVGFLAEPENFEDLANKIEKFQKLSFEKRKKMSIHAQEKVRKDFYFMRSTKLFLNLTEM